MLRLKYLIPLLIFLFVCVFLFVGLYLDPRKVPSALIDKPAPEFSLPTMSGETVTKKDLLGKVYLLNVGLPGAKPAATSIRISFSSRMKASRP